MAWLTCSTQTRRINKSNLLNGGEGSKGLKDRR